MTIKLKNKKIYGAVGILAVAGLLGIRWLDLEGILQSDAKESEGLVTALYLVEEQIIEDKTDYLGTLESLKQVTLASKIPANVTRRHFDEGDAVKEGDIILTLDASTLEAKLATLEKRRSTLEVQEVFLKEQVEDFYSTNPIMSRIASLKSSFDYYGGEAEKLRILYEMGGVSKSAYDEILFRVEGLRLQLRELQNTAEVQYEELKSQHQTVLGQLEELDSSLEEVKLAIDETAFKAPFDGVVSLIAAHEGDLVMPNQPLVKVEEPSGYKVVLSLSEGDLSSVIPGAKADLVIEGKAYEGEVSMVSPQVNEKTRMGSVEVLFKDPGQVQALMGASVRVEIHKQLQIEGIFVPRHALKELGDQRVVYVATEAGRVTERVVTTGKDISGMVEILEGLSPHENIAVRDVESLYDQAPIYLLNGEG